MEFIIRNVLPVKISLVFGGQTTGGARYVAVFACFLANDHLRFRRVCSALAPFENLEALDADEQFRLLQFLLELPAKEVGNVVGLIVENCSVNNAFLRKM